MLRLQPKNNIISEKRIESVYFVGKVIQHSKEFKQDSNMGHFFSKIIFDVLRRAYNKG